MRILSQEFMDQNTSTSREPVVVVKIINENKNIYLTSHNVTITDAGSSQFQRCIVSATGASQSIVPERGFSTIGDMSITLQDNNGVFTDELRSILRDFSDTINNNKSEFYAGLGDMLFEDYVKITPVWVSGIANDELEYTLTFSDTQRLTKASLFKDPARTELINSPLFATTEIVDLEEVPISLEVVSTADFYDILHDANWEHAPNERVGYIKVTGVTEFGDSAKEIMQWKGKTTTHLLEIKRQMFDTPLVNLDGEEKIEIEEVIYLDLSVPKMIIALLTGDLYGQAGEGIPESWNSGVSADLIDIASYETIGQDLWDQQVSFVDMDKQTAKEFIASQLLAPYGLFNYVNQNGELQLRRFGFQSQDSSSDIVLSYESLIAISPISRDFKKIRNNFLINWEWRPDKDFYARKDGYIDAASQEKFNVNSETYEIKLRGLKNRSKGSKPTLDYVAQGIATRFSNPSINITADGLMRDMISIEVGDTVTLDLPNQPDYASADSLLASFEVQGMSWDFLQGTQSLQLFTSSGTPSDFGITSGSSVSSIGHVGWTLLGSNYGSVVNGVFIFNSVDPIPTGKYYFEGDVEFPVDSTITISKDFTLDASTITMKSGALINGVGTGGTGKNYFGGADAAQEGIYQDRYGFLDMYQRFKRNKNNQGFIVPSSASQISFPSIIRVTSGEQIESILEPTLSGNGGGAGGSSRVERADDPAGGAQVPGGGGCMFICDNLFFHSSSVIDLSGSPSNSGAWAASDRVWHAGSGGFGWPGVFVCALKDRYAPKPFLGDLVVANSGSWAGVVSQESQTYYPWGSGSYRESTPGNTDYAPSPLPAASQAGKSFSAEGGTATKVIRFIQADDFVPQSGVDLVARSLAPGLSLQVAPNTPRTPGGDQSTITMTATANPADASYSYARFEYRILGQSVWYPVSYKIKSEATITVASNGLSYQIKATAHGLDKRPGASTTLPITVGFISQDSATSDARLANAPEDIKVPPVKRLELINRLGNATNWDKFKSPNAAFKWAKTSVTAGGDIITTSGHTDLHLTGYKVRIFRTTGGILREENVTDSYYEYTFEKNKKDTNGSPVREFKIDVQPIASTGFTVTPTAITVSNPAPAAVLNPVAVQTFSGIDITYDLPSDVDFVGVRIRDKVYSGSSVTITPSTVRDETLQLISVDQFGDGGIASVDAFNPQPAPPTSLTPRWGITSAKVSFVKAIDIDLIGTAYRYGVKPENGDTAYNDYFEADSNEVVLEGLSSGTQYEIEFKSVDRIGPSDAVSIVFTTDTLVASDVEGLGNWATAVDLVDLDFINANMDSNALPSTKIASLTASKITAGTLAATEYIQVGNVTDGGVLLTAGNGVDQGGYMQTIAPTVEGTSNYLITVGPHVDPLDSNTIYSFSASDGTTTPFFVNINGSASFGKLDLFTTGAISSDNFSIAEDGSAEFTGKVTVEAGSNVAAGADVTQTALNGTTTMGAGTLHLSGTDANIAIGASTTWGSDGIQFQYNAGTPKAHIGSTSNYVQYNGSKVIVETDNFSIDSSGNATFSGGGSFTGVVTVTSGSNVEAGATVGATTTQATKLNGIATGADVTQAALNGNTTMGAGTLHLSGSNANIAIGAATTWASNGIQFQYNSGTPRAHIGSTTNYVQYDGANLVIATDSIGSGASIGAGSVAFGSSADASGPNSIAIGVDSEASYVSGGSVAIGNNARALGVSGTSIGEDAYSEGNNCSAIGRDSKARGRESVALGTGADAGNEYAGSNNQGSYATAIGAFSEATAGSSTAVGAGAKANFTSSTAIGIGAETTQSSQIMLGTTSNTISALGSVYLSSYLRWNTGELFIGPLVSQSSIYDAFYNAGTFQTAAGSNQGSYEPYDNPFPISGRSRGFRIEGTGSFRIACTIQKVYSSSATGYVRFLVDNVLVYEASISYQGSAAVTLNLTGITYGSSLIIQSRITGNSNTFYVNDLKISSNSQMFYMRGA